LTETSPLLKIDVNILQLQYYNAAGSNSIMELILFHNKKLFAPIVLPLPFIMPHRW